MELNILLKNKDSKMISVDKFIEIIKETSLQITSTQLDSLVAQLDRNGDGQINLK